VRGEYKGLNIGRHYFSRPAQPGSVLLQSPMFITQQVASQYIKHLQEIGKFRAFIRKASSGKIRRKI
jgi:hypothetical protein